MSIKQRMKRGFTLVELLIVVIIIAVLAAIAIPKFANSSTRSRESALRGELKLLRNAVELFKNDCGCYPAQISDLAATAAPATGKDSSAATYTIASANWHGPYISAVDTDPIDGSSFTYSTTSGTVGKITAASGTASDGTNYNTW